MRETLMVAVRRFRRTLTIRHVTHMKRSNDCKGSHLPQISAAWKLCLIDGVGWLWCDRFEDRVCDCDQAARDCSNDELVRLTAPFEAFRQRLRHRIVTCSGACCLEGDVSKISPSSGDHALVAHCADIARHGARPDLVAASPAVSRSGAGISAINMAAGVHSDPGSRFTSMDWAAFLRRPSRAFHRQHRIASRHIRNGSVIYAKSRPLRLFMTQALPSPGYGLVSWRDGGASA